MQCGSRCVICMCEIYAGDTAPTIPLHAPAGYTTPRYRTIGDK